METKKASGIFKHIPNFITSLNVFSGSCAIVFAFNDKLHYAAFCILIAAVFDFMDGFAARLLHAYSEIGKELDSLADIVSFGVAPSAIVYNLLIKYETVFSINFLMENRYLYFAVFIITVFSALRLAKFNIDTRQTTSFLGLPTPANAIFWAAFPLIIHYNQEVTLFNYSIVELLTHPYGLFALAIVMSILLVTEIPMFSLKMKSLKFSENYIRYIFLILSIILFVFLKLIAIPFVILLYILISIISNLIITKT